MFKLENIKYKNILDIQSLTIPNGKITSIVGSSGSGKTTLLRHLNKLISPSSGSIFYFNTPLTEIDSVELRRKVVMLSQNPVIFTGTVKDNLLCGLGFSEKTFPQDNKLKEILEIVELNKPLEENAEILSGGEKQRLALGRVILMNPEVFLLDEPSSALDEETENLMVAKLASYIKANNKTLVMVTHSKTIALRFSDNIIEISGGKVVNGGDF
ncbi:ABC transporter ATP-binding protein [Clostridium tunisiense]|uniref:ABC transporter ATP-binding protein n=1 Tax=Clostridium tunisiense TaxID=219748 RepID=UPI00030FE036|nr:ABC transporter ATP-binding protein [Clostridium tunisiense]